MTYHVNQYQGIITELREEIGRLKEKIIIEGNQSGGKVQNAKQMEELKELRDEMVNNFREQMKLRWAANVQNEARKGQIYIYLCFYWVSAVLMTSTYQKKAIHYSSHISTIENSRIMVCFERNTIRRRKENGWCLRKANPSRFVSNVLICLPDKKHFLPSLFWRLSNFEGTNWIVFPQ